MSLLLSEVYRTPWAILPEKLAAIIAVVERHELGLRLSAADIEAIAKPGRPPSINGGIAVLPVFGVIVPRANLMTETSGATSAERLSAALQQAVNDPNVGAVVLDIDSPGGAVQGIDELAQSIYSARAVKPIIAAVNHLAASAAYWIASAASEIAVSPSGEVGSIGVFAAHEDVSKASENVGVKTTLISAGKYKTEGNPYEPLSDEARASIQKRVDEYYGIFTSAVARGRGVSAATVRDGYGEGRIVGAKEAMHLGMVDRVETMDETIARLQKRSKGQRAAQAELDARRRRVRAMQSV